MKNTTNRRNIGIIAHVDAGKTTVSERILYYSGAIHSSGEVHHGAATMDWDDREKSHGITISSAATTVEWRNHEITLIDTPGHVDFNLEVKRALQVLDSAVVVFDAVAGVEPQTEANWHLADEFNLPRLVFINKMDRNGADFSRVVTEIEDRFRITAVRLQRPIGSGSEFQGIICPFTECLWTWSGEIGVPPTSSPISDDLLEELNLAKADLIEVAAMLDDEILSDWLEGNDISPSRLRKAIRCGVLERKIVPILAGSALKNAGMEPLLDAVIDFLPSPEEAQWNPVGRGDETVAYAFKLTTSEHGNLLFCRLYQGVIRPGDELITNSARKEKVRQCFRMHAGDKKPLSEATAGDIVTLSGLKAARSGHTLSSVALDFRFESTDSPEPVATVAVEAPDQPTQEKLSALLGRLQDEDPSLRVSTHPESGQLLLSGMGELHLEMAREKLVNESDIAVRFGAPQIAGRETISNAVTISHLRKKQSGGPGQYAGLTIKVVPGERGSGFNFKDQSVGGSISREFIPAIERGVFARLQSGLLNGDPVVDLDVTLLDGEMHSSDSSAVAFEAAAWEAMEKALLEGKSIHLEPMMTVEVTTADEHLGSVIGDLSRRRGTVQDQEIDQTGRARIEALVPLANMFGYAGHLRSLCSGRAQFSMKFSHYAEA